MSPETKSQAPILQDRAALQAESRRAWEKDAKWNRVVTGKVEPLFSGLKMKTIGWNNFADDLSAGTRGVSVLKGDKPSEVYISLDLIGTKRKLKFLRSQEELKYLPSKPQEIQGENYVRQIEFSEDGKIRFHCGASLTVEQNANTGSEFLVEVSHDGILIYRGIPQPGD